MGRCGERPPKSCKLPSIELPSPNLVPEAQNVGSLHACLPRQWDTGHWLQCLKRHPREVWMGLQPLLHRPLGKIGVPFQRHHAAKFLVIRDVVGALAGNQPQIRMKVRVRHTVNMENLLRAMSLAGKASAILLIFEAFRATSTNTVRAPPR